MPVLIEKFKTNPARLFPSEQQTAILKASMDQQKLEALPVHEYVDLYVLSRLVPDTSLMKNCHRMYSSFF
jgi:hypothetical protein